VVASETGAELTGAEDGVMVEEEITAVLTATEELVATLAVADTDEEVATELAVTVVDTALDEAAEEEEAATTELATAVAEAAPVCVSLAAPEYNVGPGIS